MNINRVEAIFAAAGKEFKGFAFFPGNFSTLQEFLESGATFIHFNETEALETGMLIAINKIDYVKVVKPATEKAKK